MSQMKVSSDCREPDFRGSFFQPNLKMRDFSSSHKCRSLRKGQFPEGLKKKWESYVMSVIHIAKNTCFQKLIYCLILT